jgi:multiple sugar transport system substrate-binding protein
MKKKAYRVSVLLLVLTLILGLMSCTSNKTTDQQNPTESPAPTPTPTDNPTIEPTDEVVPVVDIRDEIYPAVDLGGREITIAMWWDFWPNSDSAEPSPDDEGFTQSQLDMYNSMRRIEEKYNVKIRPRNIPYADIQAVMTTAYLANEAAADIMYLHGNAMISASVFKMALPVNEYAISGDLDINSTQTIFKRRPPVGGDVYSFNGVGLINSAITMGYNKTITDSLGLGDPLELYEAGQWTWDKFLAIAKAATKDLDGDNVIDQWGYVGFLPEMFASFIFSNGSYIWNFADNTLGLGKPEAAHAIDFAAQLNYEHHVMKNADDPWNDMARISWYDGDVAFWEFQSYTAPAEPLPFEWHVISHPVGPDNTAANFTQGISTLADGYCIPKYVKDPAIVYQIFEDLNDAVHGVSLEEKLEISWENMYANYPTVEDAERQVYLSTNKAFSDNNGAVGISWLDVTGMVFYGENSATAAIESLMPQWESQIDAFFNPPTQ